jgi:hypothetical protein
MKKLLLLITGLCTSLVMNAQIDTLFIETFNPTDSVTTTNLGSATGIWRDTTNVAISGTGSYHAKVQAPAIGSNSSEVVFRTNSFSTLGKTFVFLEFYHIAKINQVNQGLLRISTDNGVTWTTLNNTNANYLGNGNWNSSSNFQEASYNIPNQGINYWFAGTDPPVANSWWQYERFDISSVATNATGYANVQVEFSCFEVLNPNLTGRTYGAGWWVDNLVITGSSCELFPPRFHFNYTPIPCFPVRPVGGLTQNASDSYKIGARVTDTVSGSASNPTWVTGIDSVTVFYRIHNTAGISAWQNQNLNVSNAPQFEFQTTLTNILLGDTVEYYYRAWDLACPNITRFPDSLANPQNAYIKFWPKLGLPFKCGAPDCGTLPGTINTFPWIEDFEGPEWIAGTGNGDIGTAHRGDFPNEQTGSRYWTLQPPESTAGYAWSIASGGTGTPFTGPNSNHTPFGAKYLYAESSQGAQNSTTLLITPCIDLTQTTACQALEFYYHFFGDDVGALRIDIDTGSNNSAWYNGYYRIRKQQQTAQTDPWERALIPLKEFNGQFIRIRFVSAKQTPNTGTAARGDMALDDLRIFAPTPIDAEVLAVSSPVRGKCFYTAAEAIEVVIRNNGCDSLFTVPLQIQTNTGAIINETVTLALRTGDTATYTLTTTANMLALGTYQVGVWANKVGDTIPANDTAYSVVINHVATYNTFPLLMDFENVTAGSSQTGNALFTTETGLDPAYVWTVGDRYTQTRDTGPKGGYYRKGQYFYTEATGSTGDVSTYMVTTQCIDFTGLNNPTLDFYYHMWGTNIENIEIEINEPATMEPETWLVVPGSTTLPMASSSTPLTDYLFKRVDLSAYANKQIRLRISANRTGAGDLADIAIDKLMIYNRIANDAGVEIVLRLGATITYGSLPADSIVTIVVPSVVVRNFGTTTLSSTNVTLSVTPLCGPNVGVPVLYTSASGVSPGPGSSATLSMNNLNLVIPKGACEVCAYTSVTGDNNNFNDTACRVIVGLGTYDIDFSDDFDNCDYDEYGFFAQSGYEQWERGEAPAGRKFSSIQTSDNIWATNLTDGYFIDGLQERLRIPILDNFDTIVSPTIRFFQNVDMGSAAAGAVEFNRAGWKTLGANLGSFQGVGQNWYTGPFGTLLGPTGTGVTQGFTGSSITGSNPTGWAYSVFPVSQLNYEPNTVPLRFRFQSPTGSNTGRNLEGWAIDDFEMIIPPQNSATPVDFFFINPLQFPTFDQFIDIVVLNSGAKILDSAQVRAEVETAGAIAWTGNFEMAYAPRFLIEGNRFRHIYSQPWNAGVASGNHTLRLITRRPNAKIDNRPSDDTTEFIVTVLPEYEFDVLNGDSVYCNDFETGNGALPFLALNTKTYSRGQWSWEKGTPTQFPGAFSGNSCWMTGLDNNYRSRDESGLFTPVFVIDTSTAYELSFVHKFDTEKYHDGGAIEASLDGGDTWTVLGFANEKDWYNTEFVTALDIIKPGWTDTADWDTARYVFKFDTSANRAIFRFRFESDYSIQRKGWAIDDFCMKATSKKPTFIIGSKEYNPVPDSYIGDLSPNPSRDITHLPIFNAQAKMVSVNIVNVVGQRMFTKDYDLERGSSQLVFETFDWNPGVYFVNISVDGERVTRKLVVQ